MEQNWEVVKHRHNIICVLLVLSEDALGPEMNMDDRRVIGSHSLCIHSPSGICS